MAPQSSRSASPSGSGCSSYFSACCHRLNHHSSGYRPPFPRHFSHLGSCSGEQRAVGRPNKPLLARKSNPWMPRTKESHRERCADEICLSRLHDTACRWSRKERQHPSSLLLCASLKGYLQASQLARVLCVSFVVCSLKGNGFPTSSLSQPQTQALSDLVIVSPPVARPATLITPPISLPKSCSGSERGTRDISTTYHRHGISSLSS